MGNNPNLKGILGTLVVTKERRLQLRPTGSSCRRQGEEAATEGYWELPPLPIVVGEEEKRRRRGEEEEKEKDEQLRDI